MNDFVKLDNIPIENLIVEREFHEKIGADYQLWLQWKQHLQAEVGFSSRGIQ